MTTVIQDDSDNDATAEQLAHAASSAGTAEAHASNADDAAERAHEGADTAVTSAAIAEERAEHSQGSADVAALSADIANNAAHQTASIRDELMGALTDFTNQMHELASAQTPQVPQQEPVPGPEKDESPGNGHWFYRKWGRGN